MKAIISTIASIVLSGEYACGLKLQLGEAQPRSYVDGEPVELLVNKLTSEKTLMPLDYYDFPFCMSRDGSESKEQNVGQFLAGDRIRLSPYRIRMKEDMYCEQLCIADLGQAEKVGAATNKAALAIRNNYHHNWIIDNIPAASKIEDVSTVTTRYWGGFPLGFVDSDTRKSYVHNHVNIEIQYHPLEDDLNRSRIVRFTVQQFSIKHQFETVDDEEAERIARIIDPVESCSPEKRPKHRTFYDHTRYEMLYSRGREPQPASGKVLFTYDVIWIENKELDWPSRWDIYVTMSNSIPDRVHWFSICNSLVVTSVLLGIVCAILVRNLRRDAILPITDEEKAESISRFGWKLIHGDVFRPPSSPLLLSICCGTGSQLLSTTFWSVVLSLSGFIHPSKRGYFATAILVLYALNASLAGYVTARLYRDFGGKYHRRAMLGAAVGFTGLASGVWFFLYEVALKNSTYAVPAKILFFIFCLMFFVSTPLALVGSHFGFKRPVMGLPVRTSSFPRPIPPQPWVRRLPLAAITGIVINFGVIFVEFYFICGALWGGQYYFSYGFLIAVLCILAIQCALTAILFNFIQLFGENYANWHWRAFIVGGSAGFGVFFYSWCFNPLQSMSSIGTSAIYFGFMGLISLAILLMTGFIGVSASLWFNKIIFSSIARDANLFASQQALLPAPVYRSNDNQGSIRGCNTGRQTLVTLMAMTALYSPVFYQPSHIHAEDEDDMYRFGIASYVLTSYDAHVIVITFLFWTAVTAFTLVIKRQSSKPGGWLYRYNQGKVRTILSHRRRQLRDILQDPVLLVDMKSRYGDLTSLLSVVEEWQTFGFNERKEECVNTRLGVVVPWIRSCNIILYLTAGVVSSGLRNASLGEFYYTTEVEERVASRAVVVKLALLSMILVHILDNHLLYREAAMKGSPKIAERGLLAAVGIPVIEVI